LQWADGVGRPTAVVVVQRDLKLPSAIHRISQAEAAGALLEATIRNQVTGSDRALACVRLASIARGCYTVNNKTLPETLDLVETAVNA
jgi:hypothetical protein